MLVAGLLGVRAPAVVAAVGGARMDGRTPLRTLPNYGSFVGGYEPGGSRPTLEPCQSRKPLKDSAGPPRVLLDVALFMQGGSKAEPPPAHQG